MIWYTSNQHQTTHIVTSVTKELYIINYCKHIAIIFNIYAQSRHFPRQKLDFINTNNKNIFVSTVVNVGGSHARECFYAGHVEHGYDKELVGENRVN